jgi:dipeptidyl aminopeptidase/acylaminoacyl peptidase
MTCAAPARITAPYGTWRSPLSAQALAAGRISFADLRAAAGRLYWTETVPAEGGITALFCMLGEQGAARLSPQGSNVRTRVHEYGGAPYLADGASVYFANYQDQRLYLLRGAGPPVALTPPGYRYADCTLQRSSDGGTTALICVREDHTEANRVRNSLVRIPLPQGGAGEVLYEESDFVAYPRLSANEQLAFIRWNHPNMPWDGTQLKVGRLTGQGLEGVRTVAGGAIESVIDPQWGADGQLYYISDRTGFWNLYAHAGEAADRPIWPRAAEFAAGLWSLGQSNYALLSKQRALARFTEGGSDQLALIDLRAGTARPICLPYAEYAQLTRLDEGHVAVIAGSAQAPQRIVRIDVDSGTAEVLRQAGTTPLDPAAISVAQAIDFPSAAGRVGHAFYYAPASAEFCGPAGESPPLLTLVHGGPTSYAGPSYTPRTQFWTSRGFAVVDVNYGGSTGYGRAYREELKGNWGVVDVEDVVAAVRFLCDTGKADAHRVAISGGSAGGYTVLAALALHREFRAGADYYGVSDMTALARDTHKFESRYLDSLIGPLPEAQPLYESRSPLNHLEGFSAPLLVLQGEDDPVVPPAQSERIVAALRSRQIPVAYLLFPGETHGFRKPENVTRAVQAELAFYGRIFGFSPAEPLPALAIENLPPERALS